MRQLLYYFDDNKEEFKCCLDLDYDTRNKTLYINKDFGRHNNETIFVFTEDSTMFHKYILGYGYGLRCTVLFLKLTEKTIKYNEAIDAVNENLLIPINWTDIMNIIVDENNKDYYTTNNKDLLTKKDDYLVFIAYEEKNTYVIPVNATNCFCGDYHCNKIIYPQSFRDFTEKIFNSTTAKELVYIDNFDNTDVNFGALQEFVSRKHLPNLAKGTFYFKRDYYNDIAEGLKERGLLDDGNSDYKFVMGFADKTGKLKPVKDSKEAIAFYTFGNISNLTNESYKSEDFDKLYESAVNEGKISDFIEKVFSGCQTKEDKTKRLLKLVSAGVISLSIAFWLVGTSITQNKAESEQIKKELVEVSSDGDKSSQNERKRSKYGNFNDDVEFGKAWKASEAGIEHIRNTEKYSSKPYYATDDEKARGILTIGYGHTIKKDDPDWVKNAKYMSKEDAEKLLRLDIEYFEIRFENSVVPNFDKRLQNPETMPQAVIDVMISLAYNAGIAGFKREERNPFYASLKQCRYDSITGKINKQDYDFTISKLPKSLIWQGEKELQGLINRRNAEYKYAKV